jgi:hypothetical protein
MQYIGHTDRDFLNHSAEVMQDRMWELGGYERDDKSACKKLAALGNGGTALVVTGVEMSAHDRVAMLHRVIDAEVAHWVPGSSQRLISRAAGALGVVLRFVNDTDCGPEAQHHVLATIHVCGKNYRRCNQCGRYLVA